MRPYVPNWRIIATLYLEKLNECRSTISLGFGVLIFKLKPRALDGECGKTILLQSAHDTGWGVVTLFPPNGASSISRALKGVLSSFGSVKTISTLSPMRESAECMVTGRTWLASSEAGSVIGSSGTHHAVSGSSSPAGASKHVSPGRQAPISFQCKSRSSHPCLKVYTQSIQNRLEDTSRWHPDPLKTLNSLGIPPYGQSSIGHVSDLLESWELTGAVSCFVELEVGW